MTDTDDYHPDADPEATEITGNRPYGEWGQCTAYSRTADRRCAAPALGPHGKCYFHGGSTPTKEENPKQGQNDQEGNDNAVTHGAFREHFSADLSEGEEAAMVDALAQLEDPAGAQDVARTAAAICLLQFQRSEDDRFLRRFEGLCDKFGIAPADELEVSGSMSLEEEFMADLKRANGHGDEE